MKKILGICTKCGFITTSHNDRFCPNCGVHLLEKCRQCGAWINYPLARYCPECGAAYKAEHTNLSRDTHIRNGKEDD